MQAKGGAGDVHAAGGAGGSSGACGRGAGTASTSGGRGRGKRGQENEQVQATLMHVSAWSMLKHAVAWIHVPLVTWLGETTLVTVCVDGMHCSLPLGQAKTMMMVSLPLTMMATR